MCALYEAIATGWCQSNPSTGSKRTSTDTGPRLGAQTGLCLLELAPACRSPQQIHLVGLLSETLDTPLHTKWQWFLHKHHGSTTAVQQTNARKHVLRHRQRQTPFNGTACPCVPAAAAVAASMQTPLCKAWVARDPTCNPSI